MNPSTHQDGDSGTICCQTSHSQNSQ